jgi:hypothetical protein
LGGVPVTCWQTKALLYPDLTDAMLLAAVEAMAAGYEKPVMCIRMLFHVITGNELIQ